MTMRFRKALWQTALVLALSGAAYPAAAQSSAQGDAASDSGNTLPTVQLYAQPGDGTGHGFGAIVHNPDYLGIWIATGGKDQQEPLHEAMGTCRSMVGEGCEPVGALNAPALAIGYGPTADFYFSVGATPEEAQAKLDENCRESFGRNCTFGRTFVLPDRGVYEPADYRRRGYAALAGGWANLDKDTAKEADQRIWFATGQASWKEAIAKAMEPCIAALGEAQCRFFTASGDTRIAIYVEKTGKNGGFTVNRTSDLVIGDVVEKCRATADQCELVDILDPQVEKVQMYDLYTVAGVPLPTE